MEKLNYIKTTAVPLPAQNVDTDQIIPARFLKATSREGFGENLFRDWRYDSEGNPKEKFVLNNPKYSGKVLIAGRNFGCGSSREHAAWALYDYGFRVVISSYYADIFKGNALNNGLLPIEISDDVLQNLLSSIAAYPGLTIEISLENQTLTAPEIDLEVKFEINAYKKECLLNGYDDIDFLLSKMEKIKEFEKKHIEF